MLLNCTTRKSVEKVVPKLFRRYPDALSMSEADIDELSQIIASLGFRNRRSRGLVKMSKAYLTPEWKHAKELPGIGHYGAAAWEIFVRKEIPKDCPKDHALTLWYKWYQRHHGENKNGRKEV
jgi:endonuclease III